MKLIHDSELTSAPPKTDAEWLEQVTDSLLAEFRRLGDAVVVIRHGTFQPMGMFEHGPAPITDLLGFFYVLSFAPGESAFRQAWVACLYDDENGLTAPSKIAREAAESLHETRTRGIENGEVEKRDLN